MKYLNLLGLMSAFEALSNPLQEPKPISYTPSPMKEVVPKGKRFVIEGVEIYAINYKNALRKYKNLS